MAEKDLEEMREAVEAIREKMAAAAREAVVNYKGKDYVKMDNKDWREYAK